MARSHSASRSSRSSRVAGVSRAVCSARKSPASRGSEITGSGKATSAGTLVIVVARERGQPGDLDNHEPGGPRLGIDGLAGVRAGRIPGDKLPGQDDPAITPAP